MLIAFFGTLSASVISVEAPQSLRTAGNIPIVFFFVGVFFDRLVELGGRISTRWGRGLVVAGLAVALLVMGQSNLKRFFGNENYGWDLLPTLIGQQAGALGPAYEVHFFSENFGAGHPPVTLFANGVPVRNHAELLEALPQRMATDKGVCFAFSDRYQAFSDYAAWLYPEAKRSQIKTKLGVPVYDTVTLTPRQAAQRFGLDAKIWPNSGFSGAPLTEAARTLEYPHGIAPALGAISAEWQGAFFVPNWATQRFRVVTRGSATFKLDGRMLASTTAQSGLGDWVQLPIGVHSLELRFHGRGQDPLSLQWERRVTPSGGGYWAAISSQDMGPLADGLLLRGIQPHGLTQRFYAGKTWEGPYTAKIDACILGRWIDWPINGPFSCIWTGSITIEKAGHYSFNFTTPNFADIQVGGRLVERRGEAYAAPDNRRSEKPIFLRPGSYPIRVRFAAASQPIMDLTWIWEGTQGRSEMIPPRLLTPDAHF
jgi:hypothetical protein